MFSVILVTYNSADVICDAISSLPSHQEVIVVDNASTDKSAQLSRELGARVLVMPENLGFGTACNRGAEIASHDRLVFLNPDARLEDGALEALERAFVQYPRAGAFNPRVLGRDGTQFFRRRTPLVRRPYLIRPPLPQEDCPIDIASGAALAFRRPVFKEIGGFDERIFLFFEDDDISFRTRQAGYELYYIHDAVVRHQGGRSSSLSDLTDFKEFHHMKSRIYVCKKHGVSFHPYLQRLRLWFSLTKAYRNRNRNGIIAAKARLRALKVAAASSPA